MGKPTRSSTAVSSEDLNGTASRPPYRVVDLFCGCGGLSRGLERTGRFVATFGVDINKAALDTFVRNHGAGGRAPAAHLGDIQQLQPAEVWNALKAYGITQPGQLDCLVGGPPCEGFSRNTVYTRRGDAEDAVGIETVAPVEYRETKYWQSAWSASPSGASASSRAVRAYNPFLSDPRNFLFRFFLDVAQVLQPKVILIENVRQILSHAKGAIAEEIVTRLGALGYRAEARILNAAEYGVPQLRQRAFFVALRNDVYETVQMLPWPERTHWAEPSLLTPTGSALPGDRGLYVTVAEALGDLPMAKAERDGNPRQPASCYPDVPLSEFRRFVRSTTETPANHVYRTPSEQVINRLRAMQPGMKTHDLPPELQTRKYYYNAYGRLEWERPANTITKSFLYPGSGKFGHPDDARVISYREAARLQSFDDDFTFYASSQEGIAHMIGSAVPPLLGFRFGQRIAELLDVSGHPGEAALDEPARSRRASRRVAAG